MKTFATLIFTLLSVGMVWAQAKFPVLKAGKPAINVREGGYYYKDYWYASPEVKKDIYYTHRFKGRERLTFISDRDSISLSIEPGHTYPFVILLNGKDSCLTEINTIRTDAERPGGKKTVTDTIPFTLGKDDRIYFTCKINGSKPLRMFFDTGADNAIVFPSAFDKGLHLNFDDSVLNTATGGTQLRKLSNFNTLNLGKLSWKHSPVMYIDKQLGEQADGTIGYDLFTDKIMEIDFDRMILIVHDRPFKIDHGYQRFPMQLNGGTIPVLNTSIHVGNEDYPKTFIVDMGATGCLFISGSFARQHDLYGRLKPLGTSNRSGAGSGVSKTQISLLPALSIGRFTLNNLPANIQLSAGADDGNELGMNLLKRFNIILDYQNQLIWLKPNSLFNSSYKYPAAVKN